MKPRGSNSRLVARCSTTSTGPRRRRTCAPRTPTPGPCSLGTGDRTPELRVGRAGRVGDRLQLAAGGRQGRPAGGLVAERVARAAHRCGTVEVGDRVARHHRARIPNVLAKALSTREETVTLSWVGFAPTVTTTVLLPSSGSRCPPPLDRTGLGRGEVVGHVGHSGGGGGVGGRLHPLELDVQARHVDAHGAQRQGDEGEEHRHDDGRRADLVAPAAC